jgi:hypothetical protein
MEVGLLTEDLDVICETVRFWGERVRIRDIFKGFWDQKSTRLDLVVVYYLPSMQPFLYDRSHNLSVLFCYAALDRYNLWKWEEHAAPVQLEFMLSPT